LLVIASLLPARGSTAGLRIVSDGRKYRSMVPRYRLASPGRIRYK
jgi:hypothetical protein